jgi:3-dehydrosphinganine reductase
MIKIVLAGLLGLPCIVVAVLTAPLITILAIPSLLLLLYRQSDNNNESSSTTTTPYHVIIVGGSSGIGLAIAKVCAKKQISKITIIARNQEKLDQAKKEIEDCCGKESTVIVEAVSVCITDYTAIEKVSNTICGDDCEDKRIVLFNCAGIPYTEEFDNVPVDVYTKLVETNQLGPMYVTKAFLRHMNQGCIVFCSSAAGQVGAYGYSIYAPTKWAIRGFAATLHVELIRSKPGVSVQVAFPADTDTPGYETEKEMMPEITKILNEHAGLANPEE